MDTSTASSTLRASLFAFAMRASLATLFAMLPYVAVLASVSAALSATMFGLAVVAELCGLSIVLTFLAEVAVFVVLTISASATWLAPELPDAVVAL
jgi:hypothetical protein